VTPCPAERSRFEIEAICPLKREGEGSETQSGDGRARYVRDTPLQALKNRLEFAITS